jgi:hypothetical protein
MKPPMANHRTSFCKNYRENKQCATNKCGIIKIEEKERGKRF